MKRALLLLLTVSTFLADVYAQKKDHQSELLSLVESEREFSRTSAAKGIRDAFLAYLADDGILFRPQPVNGKKWMRERPQPPGLLTWQPIYADISRAGDLGYTTGPWEFKKNNTDEKAAGYGHYVTIWKRQPDGQWKFVVDLGISNPPPTAPAPALQLPTNSAKSARHGEGKIDVESERSALLTVDREFLKASRERGIVGAFLSYTADDVRLFRMNTFPVTGKEPIRAVMSTDAGGGGALTWQPAVAEVSRSGDLGYTYGTYELKKSASEGKPDEKGSYVRIWKRGFDGRWRIVLDITNPSRESAPATTTQ